MDLEPSEGVSGRRLTQMPHWPDARGWIGIGVFALAFTLILLMRDSKLRGDEFFQTIATVIISNGLMAVIAWAYSATKGGGELADKNAEIIKSVAKLPSNEPQPVVVEQPADKPVPTAEAELLLDDEHNGELPEDQKL